MTVEPRIAIVSDALVQRGGAERVVEAIAEAFPDAPVFALLYSSRTGPAALSSRVRTSWLNRIPFTTERHRLFLPLYRQAIESIDVSSYDVVVSSHHTVAKSVLTRADQLHISYCHTPMRALWDRPAAELATLPRFLRPPASALFSHLRVWDAVSSARVQHFIANSSTTKRRIAAYYRRTSRVLPPPIDTAFFSPGGKVDDYYLVASRPVPYKRIDIAVAACAKLGRRLKIVGGRPNVAGAPENIEFLGHVTNEELRTLMRGTRALLFPQLEDFGMTPLEVNACGRPVIAYAAGGALDTVLDGRTGILAPHQSVTSFVAAIERFEQADFDPSALRDHALRFSKQHFVMKMREIVRQTWSAHQKAAKIDDRN